MVNRANTNFTATREDSARHEAAGVGKRSPETPSSFTSKSFNDNVWIDDLIGSLANEYENKRARQVVEWERLYRQSLVNSTYRSVA